MSLPSVMITSQKATQQSMTYPSLSVPNATQTIIDASGPGGTTTAISPSFAFSSFSRPQLLAWAREAMERVDTCLERTRLIAVVSLKRSLTKGTWTC